ncbi:MAG: hypothetical protein KGN16_07830 [Burkholderiales bacterium]|nr:hypothetical protein [Burkholderiales bacterium]
MQPSDPWAREEAAWSDFVGRLAAQLAAQWPTVHERLGERHAEFVATAVQRALDRGIDAAPAVARYVNLWFVWGPSFHDKPGFEWAQGLLAAPPERAWATVHQLVRRSVAELERRGNDARATPQALIAADERLIDAFGRRGRQGAMVAPPAAPPPRRACDLEAAELRLIEAAPGAHYVIDGKALRREPLSAPAPLRVTAATPLPPVIALLAHEPGRRPPAQLQLRSRSHAACDGDRHPALEYAGTHGLWRWQGHETRAVSWPVATLAQRMAAPGMAIAEETTPDIFRLEIQTCGLRDEGDAIGSPAAQVWVWPAAQTAVEIEREIAPAQPVVAARAPAAPGRTRCRVERDGAEVDAAALQRAFAVELEAATARAQQAWLAALAAVAGASEAKLEGQLGLLLGHAALTWGWRLGTGGMAGAAFMRLWAGIGMQACRSDLHFEAELAQAGARARLALHAAGSAALALQMKRDAAEPALLDLLLPARTEFEIPLVAELTPLASDSGALLQAGGPLKGALAGSAGLRPRSGGSGWTWFATLRLTAATLPLVVVDPVLGTRSLTLPLWPEQTLCEWSAG